MFWGSQPMEIALTATKQALLGHPSKSPFFLAWVLLGMAGLWLRLTRHVCVWGGAEVGPGLVVAGVGQRCTYLFLQMRRRRSTTRPVMSVRQIQTMVRVS